MYSSRCQKAPCKLSAVSGRVLHSEVLIVSGVGAVAAGTPREAPLDFERAGDLGPLASVRAEHRWRDPFLVDSNGMYVGIVHTL